MKTERQTDKRGKKNTISTTAAYVAVRWSIPSWFPNFMELFSMPSKEVNSTK